MDLLTHAVFGASLAAAIAPCRQRRLSAVIGAVAGVLPDADALIQSGEDALLVLDFHRHFTHAMAFVPLGALLATLLCWPLFRRKISFGRAYLYSLVGYGFSGVLDACTSYGTHLWLPFSQDKVAWNLIAVFDPWFTLLLLIPLLLSLRRPESSAVRIGLLLAGVYLGMGYVQQQRVITLMAKVAMERGHLAERLTVKPTLGNLLLWRALYVNDGQVQADAVHAGWALRHYAGQRAPLLVTTDGPHQADIERFRHFADDFLVQPRPGFVGDARYAMLPTDIEPIWGIEWTSEGKLLFITRHDMTKEMRQRWLAMLLGRD
jgi:inner membrane protein